MVSGIAKRRRGRDDESLDGYRQLHHAVPLVERQHRLIEELRINAPRFVTGDALAESLAVSTRTIEQDVARLCAAGVPIAVRRGPAGGYAIDAGAAVRSNTFTPGVAAALISAVVAFGVDGSASAQSAVSKLLATLTDGCPTDR